MAPRITVLITACSRSEQLVGTLTACREQARFAPCELLLVVNAAEHELPAADAQDLRGRADRVLFVPEPGKSRALNAALQLARGEVVAFIDDDATPDPGWLQAITAPLLEDRGPWVGTGGAVLPVFPAGGPPAWYRQILARQPSCFLGPSHFLGNEPMEYPVPEPGVFSPLPFGANCAYRREPLLTRPFPEELGPNRRTGRRGGEDTAVALGLLLEGERLLHVPGARVYHPVPRARMTLQYVRDGYVQQAEELVILHRRFEIPSPTASGIRRGLRRARRRAAAWWRTPSQRVRHGLTVHFLERQLGELSAK